MSERTLQALPLKPKPAFSTSELNADYDSESAQWDMEVYDEEQDVDGAAAWIGRIGLTAFGVVV
jgi:hypothetical protein